MPNAVGAVAAMAAVAALAVLGIYEFFTRSSRSSSTTNKAAHACHAPPSQRFESKALAIGSATEQIPRAALMKWSSPPKGWLKINTDASLKTNPTSFSVAIGGVVRNDNGVWILGFARIIPSCFIAEVELWAVKEGLMLAWENGFKKIEVGTDSEVAIWFVNEANFSNYDLEFGQMIEYCRNLLERDWFVRLQHCIRGANSVADYMANFGHDLGYEIKSYDTPPMGVVPLLNRDHL